MPQFTIQEYHTNHPVPVTWNSPIIPRIGEGIYDCQSGRSWYIKDVKYCIDKGEIYEIAIYIE
jgi:hypothetical protein